MNSNAHAQCPPDCPPRRGAGPAPTAARGPCLRWRRLCLALTCGLLLPAAAAAAAEAGSGGADETTIGTRVGAGFTVGGWATLQLDVPRAGSVESDAGEPERGHAGDNPHRALRTRLGISHLSAMLWWDPSPAWKLLAEVDGKNTAQLPTYRDSDDGPAAAPYLALERLYVDYRATDALGLRVGKFLTPIGRWNQNHADPLTWTTVRPLISRSAFPTNATGLLLFGSVAVASQGLDYEVFASGHEDWRSDPRSTPFGRALGARIVAPIGNDLQVGVSVARYERRDDLTQQNHLIGADFVWNAHGAEISGEALARRSGVSDDSGERGGYLQAVLPLAPRWYATARVEVYKRSEDAAVTRSALLGVVYRLGRHAVAKAEWAQPSGNARGLPQGLLASMTLLF